MPDIEEQLEELGRQNKELRDLSTKVMGDKVQLTQAMLFSALETVEEGIGKLVVQNDKNVYFDKELATVLKTTISDAIAAISQIKAPEVNVTVSPANLSPLSSTLNEWTRQNDLMIKLLTKLSGGDGGKLEELQNLIVTMIGRQNDFLERTFKEFDYTKPLEEMAKAINGRKAVPYKGKITKRTDDRLIDEFEINPNIK